MKNHEKVCSAIFLEIELQLFVPIRHPPNDGLIPLFELIEENFQMVLISVADEFKFEANITKGSISFLLTICLHKLNFNVLRLCKVVFDNAKTEGTL